MEILDPDLWNDDGTPKRPSKKYMASLEAIQQHADGLMRVVDGTTPIAATEKQIVDAGYLNYARVKREAKAARSPEVGDIVHEWNGEGCYAAIVMETDSFGDGALLRVHVPKRFLSGAMFIDLEAPHDEDKESSATWHWPCGEGQ